MTLIGLTSAGAHDGAPSAPNCRLIVFKLTRVASTSATSGGKFRSRQS